MVTASFFCSCPSLPDGCPGMTQCGLSPPSPPQPQASRVSPSPSLCRTSACPTEALVRLDCRWAAFPPEPSWTPWSGFTPLPGAARSSDALLRTNQTVLWPRAPGCPPELGHLPLHVQTGPLSHSEHGVLTALSASCSVVLSFWVLPVFRTFPPSEPPETPHTSPSAPLPSVL